jgi:hypothetical protein
LIETVTGLSASGIERFTAGRPRAIVVSGTSQLN